MTRDKYHFCAFVYSCSTHVYRYLYLIDTLVADRDVSWTYSVFRYYTTYVKTHHPDCFPSGMNKIQGEIHVQKPLIIKIVKNSNL